MALYQGEDIALSLSGNELVDFTNSNFVVLIYSKNNKNDELVIQGKDFEALEDGTYLYTIDRAITYNMKGAYTLEIMLESKEEQEEEKTRSIYIQDNAFFVEQSKIKDKNISYD